MLPTTSVSQTNPTFCQQSAAWVKDNPTLVTTLCLVIIAGMAAVIYTTDFSLASKITIGVIGGAYIIAIPLLLLAKDAQDDQAIDTTPKAPVEQCHDHHCHHHEVQTPAQKRLMKVMKVLEVVSLVFLAVIACYTNYKLFLPFFGAGVLLGTYMYWNIKERPVIISDGDSGGCSQGTLEQLTGVKLPAPIALAVNVAMTYEHVVHHSKIFPPIIGLNAGVFIGKYLGYYLPKLYRDLTASPVTA